MATASSSELHGGEALAEAARDIARIRMKVFTCRLPVSEIRRRQKRRSAATSVVLANNRDPQPISATIREGKRVSGKQHRPRDSQRSSGTRWGARCSQSKLRLAIHG